MMLLYFLRLSTMQRISLGTCLHGNDCFSMVDTYFLRLSTVQQISLGSLFALACMAMAALA